MVRRAENSRIHRAHWNIKIYPMLSITEQRWIKTTIRHHLRKITCFIGNETIHNDENIERSWLMQLWAIIIVPWKNKTGLAHASVLSLLVRLKERQYYFKKILSLFNL